LSVCLSSGQLDLRLKNTLPTTRSKTLYGCNNTDLTMIALIVKPKILDGFKQICRGRLLTLLPLTNSAGPRAAEKQGHQSEIKTVHVKHLPAFKGSNSFFSI
jgi:hypothetical protein